MIFKGKNIGGGDMIYDMRGNSYRIDSWSPGTGSVWARTVQITPDYFKNVEVDLLKIEDLTWHPPFKSVRGHPRAN